MLFLILTLVALVSFDLNAKFYINGQMFGKVDKVSVGFLETNVSSFF